MNRKLKYYKLGIGILGVSFLAFFIIPKINDFLLGDKQEIIKSRNLDSGALFYSDSEEAVKGNFLLLKD